MGFAAPLLSAVAIGASAYQSHNALQAQKKGLKLQERAQAQATASAESRRRQELLLQRKTDRNKPDIAALLAAAQGSIGSPNSTFLSGQSGHNQLGT